MSNLFNSREIKGISETLKRKGAEIERAAKAALRESANEIVDEAKSRVPVKTGKLRDSIHSIQENEGLTIKITADAVNEKGVNYAQYVEYDPRINQPFLYPAIENNREKFTTKIKAAFRRGV